MRAFMPQRSTARFPPNAPISAGVNRGLGGRISLHQEAGSIAHLRHGSELTEVPYDGRKDIPSRLQQRSKINRLEPPVE
jgi:hypothetical protein